MSRHAKPVSSGKKKSGLSALGERKIRVHGRKKGKPSLEQVKAPASEKGWEKVLALEKRRKKKLMLRHLTKGGREASIYFPNQWRSPVLST